MPIELGDFEAKAREAIKTFWNSRNLAGKVQEEKDKYDHGNRGKVTAGKNMDGFVSLVSDIVVANGIPEESVCLRKRVLTLPGFFRPTKSWDFLVVHQGKLIAVVEFKSQVGSFGNNFNNRTEEAIGNGLDLATAFREGAFGDQARPYVGWLMLLEDASGSRRPINDKAPHFPVFPEFAKASYADRYHILCRKMIQENLYDAASILMSPNTAGETGEYSEFDEMTGLRTFVTQLAAHVAAAVAV